LRIGDDRGLPAARSCPHGDHSHGECPEELISMRSYELMIIHRPDMVETDVRRQIEEVSATIDTSGNVTGTDFWGKRRFAYEIDHMNEGYYSVLDFEGETNLVEALDRALSLSDAVVRHKLILRTDR
jgi:small subunit ribosomal protein S6